MGRGEEGDRYCSKDAREQLNAQEIYVDPIKQAGVCGRECVFCRFTLTTWFFFKYFFCMVISFLLSREICACYYVFSIGSFKIVM